MNSQPLLLPTPYAASPLKTILPKNTGIQCDKTGVLFIYEIVLLVLLHTLAVWRNADFTVDNVNENIIKISSKTAKTGKFNDTLSKAIVPVREE